MQSDYALLEELLLDLAESLMQFEQLYVNKSPKNADGSACPPWESVDSARFPFDLLQGKLHQQLTAIESLMQGLPSRPVCRTADLPFYRAKMLPSCCDLMIYAGKCRWCNLHGRSGPEEFTADPARMWTNLMAGPRESDFRGRAWVDAWHVRAVAELRAASVGNTAFPTCVAEQPNWSPEEFTSHSLREIVGNTDWRTVKKKLERDGKPIYRMVAKNRYYLDVAQLTEEQLENYVVIVRRMQSARK